jgi:hypothetical protein
VAGVDEAQRRPRRPSHEHRLIHPVVADRCGVPVVGAEVQLERRRRRRGAASPAVVVAVVGLHPGEVLGPSRRGERVAVAHAQREAPQREVDPLQRWLELLVLAGHRVVLAGVRAVGDVVDAGERVPVAARAGVQAAVDAQGACRQLGGHKNRRGRGQHEHYRRRSKVNQERRRH